MDWIRRNWPDLLIGLALILVISGIIITLLNGGTFNPFGQRGAGTASLPSRPAATAAPEADAQLGVGAEDAEVSVLPLPSVNGQAAGQDANQADATATIPADTAADTVLGDGVDAVANGAANAGESLSDTASAAGNAVEGVLPDPNEAALGDADAAASDIEVAELGATDANTASDSTNLDTTDLDAATDAALTDSALDDSVLDDSVLDDAAQQTGSVEAVLPDDASAGASAENSSTNSADPNSTALDSATSESADSQLGAAPANVAASSSADAPYRISAGSFGVAANAERLASELRAANYPVFTARQGNLNIVLVGPYDERAQAEQIAEQLETSGLTPGTEVYEFDPSVTDDSVAAATQAPASEVSNTQAETQAATTQTQSEAVSSEPLASELPSSNSQSSEVQAGDVQASEVQNEAATQPGTAEVGVDSSASETLAVGGSPTNANIPPTAETGSYLQVGAYGSVESSNPQRRALEDLGFTVLYVEEQGLIKLLVGPYDAQNLTTAKSQLGSQGIGSFIR